MSVRVFLSTALPWHSCLRILVLYYFFAFLFLFVHFLFFIFLFFICSLFVHFFKRLITWKWQSLKSILSLKIFLIENEFKTMGVLHSCYIKNIFMTKKIFLFPYDNLFSYFSNPSLHISWRRKIFETPKTE